MHFDFCPLCGSKLVLREAGDDGLTPYCEPCQKMWFDMFPSCVIVIVANEYDEIALLHQPGLSDRGVFVSGYITPGESAEAAAMREVKEELNIDITHLELLGVYSGKKYHHIYPNGDETSCIDIVYVCHKFIGDISYADGEVTQAKWFDHKTIPDNLSDNPKDAIKDYYKKYFNIDIGFAE